MTERVERSHDLVVYGATSFVGRLLCEYLVERHGTEGSLRWAIAGRDPERLEEVAERTGAEVDRITADSTDPDSLDTLVRDTRVIVSTVGPYALYGSDLVRAAAQAGTDYCDLSGEPQWISKMIDEYHDTAVSTGARILFACGFDSIPSDLGVWFTQQRSMEDNGEPCESISMRVESMNGGASGGTIASMVNLVGEATADRDVRRILADPYALCPVDQRSGVEQPDIRLPVNDPNENEWVAPFIMSAINTRIVHRTNAILGHPWGRGFRYDEGMSMGPGPLGLAKSAGLSAALGLAMGASAIGPIRRLLSEYVLPKPGSGPDATTRSNGFFRIRFHGVTASGRSIATRVSGERDPGYGCTARMLGETAFALVESDTNQSIEDRVGGVWTPAALFGDGLIDRLAEHADVEFRRLDRVDLH